MSYGVESIQIHKKLRLDKRAGSDNWYARLTLPNGKRLIKTTKTEDLESAKEAALRLYYETDARIQNKLPATTRKFADVARCLIPWFDGAIYSLEWKEALWDKFVMVAPRPRTPSEQQYSDRKLRTRR